jgi:hypothetical protein
MKFSDFFTVSPNDRLICDPKVFFQEGRNETRDKDLRRGKLLRNI